MAVGAAVAVTAATAAAAAAAALTIRVPIALRDQQQLIRAIKTTKMAEFRLESGSVRIGCSGYFLSCSLLRGKSKPCYRAKGVATAV